MKHIFLAKRVIFILPFILILLFVGGTYFFYNKYQQALHSQPTPSKQNPSTKLTEIIGKFMELPSDETPVIATITDITKLKNQSFFAHAKNGDEILIYTKNRKAILYDPHKGKVVEVGPVFITTASNSGTTVAREQNLRTNTDTSSKLQNTTSK